MARRRHDRPPLFDREIVRKRDGTRHRVRRAKASPGGRWKMKPTYPDVAALVITNASVAPVGDALFPTCRGKPGDTSDD